MRSTSHLMHLPRRRGKRPTPVERPRLRLTISKSTFVEKEGPTALCGSSRVQSTLPLRHYAASCGLNRVTVTEASERYGRNVLSITPPQFLDLWVKQMLSPISVFQLFSSALWLLDAYWQYFAMTIVQILILELTTVWQKVRTQKTLQNMCSKPYGVLVYRSDQWLPVSTEELLPGDLVSLKSVAQAKAKKALVNKKVRLWRRASAASSASANIFRQRHRSLRLRPHSWKRHCQRGHAYGRVHAPPKRCDQAWG